MERMFEVFDSKKFDGKLLIDYIGTLPKNVECIKRGQYLEVCFEPLYPRKVFEPTTLKRLIDETVDPQSKIEVLFSRTIQPSIILQFNYEELTEDLIESEINNFIDKFGELFANYSFRSKDQNFRNRRLNFFGFLLTRQQYHEVRNKLFEWIDIACERYNVETLISVPINMTHDSVADNTQVKLATATYDEFFMLSNIPTIAFSSEFSFEFFKNHTIELLDTFESIIHELCKVDSTYQLFFEINFEEKEIIVDEKQFLTFDEISDFRLIPKLLEVIESMRIPHRASLKDLAVSML